MKRTRKRPFFNRRVLAMMINDARQRFQKSADDLEAVITLITPHGGEAQCEFHIKKAIKLLLERCAERQRMAHGLIEVVAAREAEWLGDSVVEKLRPPEMALIKSPEQWLELLNYLAGKRVALKPQ